MAFKFRLESVLDHRRHLEDKALHAFARELKVQRECERHIDWLEREHRRARQDLEKRELSGMPAPQFQLANEYATVLRLQALREQARLPMLRAAVEAARAKLIEAQRDRKVLEALRDRHRLRWEREQLKAEQKMIDEAAVSAYIRRRSA